MWPDKPCPTPHSLSFRHARGVVDTYRRLLPEGGEGWDLRIEQCVCGYFHLKTIGPSPEPETPKHAKDIKKEAKRKKK